MFALPHCIRGTVSFNLIPNTPIFIHFYHAFLLKFPRTILEMRAMMRNKHINWSGLMEEVWFFSWKQETWHVSSPYPSGISIQKGLEVGATAKYHYYACSSHFMAAISIKHIFLNYFKTRCGTAIDNRPTSIGLPMFSGAGNRIVFRGRE